MPLSRRALLVTACGPVVACRGLVPGSRAYQPLPKWEAGFAQKARRDVFPSQVRQDAAAWANTLVVWTGVIAAIDYKGDGAERSARILADHHYFDWIEDSGIQREKYFLSPRGDGRFAAYWGVGDPGDQQFIDQFDVGDMLVAYGNPSAVKPEFVGLSPTLNMRAIKPSQFRTDVLDYGRPGEPARRSKTPL